jgi:prepilin-type N-terminal cleavage/methylation domain-containing protein
MKKGFTLVEIVIVIVMMAIVSFFIAVYMREGINAWQYMCGQKNITLSTRAAMNRIVKELKRAKQNTNITTHTTTEITFLDVYNDTITFSQEGTVLYRNSDILLEGLLDPGGLVFTYLDKDGNVTAITNEMRVVRCRLTVVEEENRFILESAARIRVRKIK